MHKMEIMRSRRQHLSQRKQDLNSNLSFYISTGLSDGLEIKAPVGDVESVVIVVPPVDKVGRSKL